MTHPVKKRSDGGMAKVVKRGFLSSSLAGSTAKTTKLLTEVKPNYMFVALEIHDIVRDPHRHPCGPMPSLCIPFLSCDQYAWRCQLPVNLDAARDATRDEIQKDPHFRGVRCIVTAMMQDEEQLMLVSEGLHEEIPE